MLGNGDKCSAAKPDRILHHPKSETKCHGVHPHSPLSSVADASGKCFANALSGPLHALPGSQNRTLL